MLCLSGFELYSRWVPLNNACHDLSIRNKRKNNAHFLSRNLPAGEKIHWNKQHFGTR